MSTTTLKQDAEREADAVEDEIAGTKQSEDVISLSPPGSNGIALDEMSEEEEVTNA